MTVVNSENPDYSLEDVINAEEKIDIQRNNEFDTEIENRRTEKLEEEIENLDSDSSIEEKKKIEENPVAELEEKLKAVKDKSEDSDSEGDPFENHKHVDKNPFEA